MDSSPTDYLLTLTLTELKEAADEYPVYRKIYRSDAFWERKVKADYGENAFRANDLPWKNTWDYLSQRTVIICIENWIYTSYFRRVDPEKHFHQGWIDDHLPYHIKRHVKLMGIVVDRNKIRLIFSPQSILREECAQVLLKTIREYIRDIDCHSFIVTVYYDQLI